jgi:hypothetical protein
MRVMRKHLERTAKRVESVDAGAFDPATPPLA